MEATEPKCKKSKVNKNKIWIADQSFTSATEAKEAIKALQIWSISYKNKTLEGDRHYYRCNKAKKRGLQCAAELSLFYPNDSLLVNSFITASEHTHDQFNNNKISSELKIEIENLLNLNVKPKSILQEINAKHNSSIKMAQLRKMKIRNISLDSSLALNIY